MFRPVFIVLAGVVVIAAAIAISVFSTRHEEQPAPVAAAPAPPPPATSPAPPSPTPRFDVVRIDGSGHGVIAGRSLPDAKVTILDAGKALGTVTGDAKGEWVFLTDGPLASGNRELSLRAENPDGTTVESEAPVVLAVPPRGNGLGPALAFKVQPNGAVELLQGPDAGPGAGPISILSVAVEDGARLSVGGKATPEAKIELFIDDVLFGETTADETGSWQVGGADRLPAGTHAVRADQLGGDGKVAARAEVEYEAQAAELAQATPAPGAPGPAEITVRPGTSLWRIARRTYGHGYQYVVIFQANQGQIRNPNLIFPGQVFRLPTQ